MNREKLSEKILQVFERRRNHSKGIFCQNSGLNLIVGRGCFVCSVVKLNKDTKKCSDAVDKKIFFFDRIEACLLVVFRKRLMF